MSKENKHELSTAKNNRTIIIEELKKFIDIINQGLNFYGIHAKINELNNTQLDFYDFNGTGIGSHKYDDNCLENSLKNTWRHLQTTIEHEGKKIEFSLDTSKRDDDKLIFNFSSAENDRCGVGIVLICDNSYGCIQRVEATSTDTERRYNIIEFDISNDCIKVNLDNQSGPYGNHVDGENRTIWYDEDVMQKFFMTESLWSGTPYRQICWDRNDECFHYKDADGNDHSVGPYRADCYTSKFREMALSILRHSRNQETIKYAIDELDKQMPSFKTFVNERFPKIFDNIFQDYVPTEHLELLITNTILPECNIHRGQKLERIEDKKN